MANYFNNKNKHMAERIDRGMAAAIVSACSFLNNSARTVAAAATTTTRFTHANMCDLFLQQIHYQTQRTRGWEVTCLYTPADSGKRIHTTLPKLSHNNGEASGPIEARIQGGDRRSEQESTSQKQS